MRASRFAWTSSNSARSESGTEALPAFLSDDEEDKTEELAASDPEEPQAVAAE